VTDLRPEYFPPAAVASDAYVLEKFYTLSSAVVDTALHAEVIPDRMVWVLSCVVRRSIHGEMQCIRVPSRNVLAGGL
jgi:hypothetical protein